MTQGGGKDVMLTGFPESDHGRLAEVVRAAGGRAVFLADLPTEAPPSGTPLFVDAEHLGSVTSAVIGRLAEAGVRVGVIVGTSDPEQARAMGQAGAEDYRRKPLTAEVVGALLRQDGDDPATSGFVTESPAVRRLLEQVRKLAASEGAGLLCGASGTGKERLAEYIHQHSRRAEGPFVAVNCAALPEQLLESELFGHEKGAFTGADQRRPGRFHQADGGTLLLDEVTEMPSELQAKLLRVLQEGQVDRVGGRRPEPVDVRVLATTNRDPEEAVAEGRLRSDLLYRLAVFRVRLPGLEQRPEDIPVLAEHFIRLYADRYGRRIRGLAEAAREALQARSWPGNVRELENAIHRAVVLADGEWIGPEALDQEELTVEAMAEPQAVVESAASPAGTGDGPETTALPEQDLTIREMEELLIERTLERVGGNRTRAAELLGVSIRTLRNKLNQGNKVQ